MKYTKQLRRIIRMLRKADPKKFVTGYTYLDTGEMEKYCSLGIVANELGFDYKDYTKDFTTRRAVTTGLQYVREKLKIPMAVTSEIMDYNDNSNCFNYACVADKIEKNLINKDFPEYISEED